ncbi:hypothetical protein BRAS3843_940016 [Bradyrhizobium sp. STM 3843]|nr:hypothetical protein BRAS3843_940016 [Bradyrhizobium sp. STM 3843]
MFIGAARSQNECDIFVIERFPNPGQCNTREVLKFTWRHSVRDFLPSPILKDTQKRFQIGWVLKEKCLKLSSDLSVHSRVGNGL